MESSSGAGALATEAAPFPNNPYTDSFERGGMTILAMDHDPIHQAAADGDDLLFQTPDPSRYMDHQQASNVRESTEGLHGISGPESAAIDAANILANAPLNARNGLQSPSFDHLTRKETLEQIDENMQKIQQLQAGLLAGDEYSSGRPQGSQLDTTLDPQNAKAFAKLVFPDGDFFITTHDVMLGRNMDVFEQLKRQKKAQRKARDTLDSYRQEPSQPSQPDDGDLQAHPSNSSQSLEGRPAPPSNISEHGGMVSYQAHSDGELEMQRVPKRKRRSLQFSKSSSTTSIAPASLHPGLIPDLGQTSLFTADGEPENRTFASIPIHTPVPEHITKISKEHLLFSFNFQAERWELHVIGNRAFVNDELFEKNAVVNLDHNDEIMIASVHMVFKLPDNFRHSPGLSRGTFSRHSEASDDEDVDVGTSPVRRLSNAMEAGESDDDEDDDADIEDDPTRPKLKLNIKNKLKKNKAQLKKENAKAKPAGRVEKPSQKRHKNDPVQEKSPDAVKKAGKGKKPKPAMNEPADAHKEEKISPPAAPPQIEPGSALDGIPIEELPQKRKGPGRPPKNGLVSKRDQAMVTKKIKEYEKRGEKAPAYDLLVQLVRAENKAKEQQAKMYADGQVPPDVSVLPSIEMDTGIGASRVDSGQSKENPDQTSATPAEPVRKGSPKPKRTARSLSPFKLESEYTEEELKKPSGTYVHILDEILRNHPTGTADLQDIYDRIAKRYPHYKFRVGTLGWQSSVRHNLLQNERFIEVGKSGKGRYWTINHEVSIEKEKKRRATPPMRPPMPNGQYMQQPHYGQPQYGNPYAQNQPNGQMQYNAGAHPGSGAYFSPYAQPGQNRGYGMHNQPGVNTNQPHLYSSQHLQNPQAHSNAQQANNDANALPPTWNGLVNEIMEYRVRFLQPFTGTPEYEDKQAMFAKVTAFLSDSFHDGIVKDSSGPPPSTDEEKEVAAGLEILFRKYEKPQREAQAKSQAQSEGSGSVQQAVNQAVENGNAAMPQPADAKASLPVHQTASTDAVVTTQPTAPTTTLADSSIPATASNGEVPDGALQGEAQVAPQPSGTKRSAEDSVDQPEAKRAREG